MIKWIKRFLMASVAVTPVTMAAAPPVDRDPLKISDMAVMDTAARPARTMTQADYDRMKNLAAPAEGVVPTPADAKMAMDSYFPSANQFIAGVPFFDEDITFPGYPFLAALAQRAEYRMIVNAFSREMTRKWIEFAGADKAEKITELEAELKRLRVRELIGDMIDMDGYFGRAQILPDFGDEGVSNALPLLRTPETVKKGSLKGFLLIEPIWSYPAAFNTSNPFKPDFYKPSGWWFVGKSVHVSRVFTLITHPVPDILKPMYAFGGLARTQLAKPYVDNWLRTRQSVSDTIHNYSVWAFKTNMSNVLAGGAVTEINKRAQIFNNMRDTRGVAVIDKDDEDFTNTSQPLTTLDDLQAQSQEHLASVAGVPLVVLLQITPKGLNTSTDGEMQVWHERVHSEQETHLPPILDPMIELAQLNIWGAIDPDITYRFLPLQEPDAVQEATIRKTDADTAVAYITAGVLAPEDERERIAKADGSLWHGMPLSEPEPPEDDSPDEDAEPGVTDDE